MAELFRRFLSFLKLTQPSSTLLRVNFNEVLVSCILQCCTFEGDSIDTGKLREVF